MSKKGGFVSILEDSHLFINNKTRPKIRKLLKQEQMKPGHGQPEKVQWHRVNGSEAEVGIIEEQDRITGVQFRCKCGCHAELKLEYEQ
ncbi:MAG: hypothetical protein WAN36_15000 [Calditrichia bacterium]